MIIANKDTIDLYNKMIEARKKIKFIRNLYNKNISIYIKNKFLGNFTEEELREKGLL